MEWRAFGMRNEYQIVEKEGRFHVVYVLARTGEEPHQYPITDGAGHLVASRDRAIAEWFCEIAERNGLEEAQAQLRARFEFEEEPRPDTD